MNSKIDIKHIQDIDSFANLKEQWSRLLSIGATQSVFLSWEWLYSWWKVYGEKRQLWLMAAWRGQELAGIAPLTLERRKKLGIELLVLTSLGTPQSDIGGFIYQTDDMEIVDVLLSYLAKRNHEWDILELHEFSQSCPEISAMKHLSSQNRMPILEDINHHYHIPLEGNWESYKQKLPRKFRYNLGRAVRLAEEVGRVEFRHYEGGSMNEDVIQMIIEINGHSHHPRLNNLSVEQEFLRTLSWQMAEVKSFGAYLLFINGRPVAYEYGFHRNSRFEDWRAGFDTRMPSNISIGKALAMMVIEACYNQSIKEIDFLRGDEFYKLEWKPAAREYVNLRIFNTGKFKAALAYQWFVNLKPRVRQLLPQK